MKRVWSTCESLADWRMCALVAILGLANNANAVIRSPFPSRPLPPDRPQYILIGHDSINAWPKAVKPAPSR